jgi:hypothetical protein
MVVHDDDDDDVGAGIIVDSRDLRETRRKLIVQESKGRSSCSRLVVVEVENYNKPTVSSSSSAVTITTRKAQWYVQIKNHPTFLVDLYEP